jgi:arabinofuranan 3-O-arabinosyltransferase
LLSAAFVRWRHRAYFVGLIVVGVAIGVGTHPYDDPSPFGAVVKSFGEGSTIGLGLRSVGRAVPLVVLGVAVLLGIGANLLARHLHERDRPRVAIAACALMVVLAAVNLPSFWTGEVFGENVQRREDIPAYWTEAIAALDHEPHDTRILELPGMDAMVYRWGDTTIPVTPGLTDRPFVARELIPYGSAASANLLDAFDRRIQRGLLEPAAIAPIAALMSVGDVVVRSDLEVDQYDLARPREVWAALLSTPDGLTEPRTFGRDLGRLELAQLDARELRIPAAVPTPHPVVVFPVERTRDLLRAESAAPIVLISGDGDGLVDLAEAGLVGETSTLRYSGSFADDAAGLERELRAGAVIVVTDTNRSRAQHWSEHDDLGHTLRRGERARLDDDQDHELDVFPGAGSAASTFMDQRGSQVTASDYGTATRFVPSDRPARAFDRDTTTAWRVGAYGPVRGEWIGVELERDITTGAVNLVQPLTGRRDRYLTRVELRFRDRDGASVGEPVTVDLGSASRTAAGQEISFESRRFAFLDVVVVGDNVGERDRYNHLSAVGLAEIRIGEDPDDVRVTELVRMPTDLVGTRAARRVDSPLVYEMTRLRTVLNAPNVSEEEARLVRTFLVPARRTFGITGTARLSPSAPGEVIDQVLGIPDAASGGVTARASGHLRTTARARASSAIDGDARTAWVTNAEVSPVGEWVDFDVGQTLTFDHMDLELVADGRHSVPTRLRLEAGGETRTVDLPAVNDTDSRGATTAVDVSFPPLTGDRLKIEFETIRAVDTVDYDSGRVTPLPVAIAELGIPGVTRPSARTELPPTCRTDLVDIGGAPVPIRVVGMPRPDSTTASTFAVEPCGVATGIDLARGKHDLRAAPGAETGIDIDRLVLASAPGGDAIDGHDALVAALEPDGPPPPVVDVIRNGRTKITARARGADAPFWLVLGQSLNQGWNAEVNGEDLGEPELVDGMANGWRIEPDQRNLEITLEWKPQRIVWGAIIISVLTLLTCLLLVVRGRSRAAAPRADDGDAPEAASPLVAIGATPTRRHIVVTTATVALLSGLLVEPWVGVMAGGAALTVLLAPRLRWLLTIGAPVALAVTGVYVLVQQSRYNYPPGLDWPSRFDAVHVVGLIAVMLLLTDVIVDRVRSRAGTDGSGLDTP